MVMTIKAAVHNHSIALPADLKIAEGTEVRVILLDQSLDENISASPCESVTAWMDEFVGVLETLPPDAAERHDYYRRERILGER